MKLIFESLSAIVKSSIRSRVPDIFLPREESQ